MSTILTFATEADELEHVIAELDTLYECGDDCIHPLTGEEVTDAAYDVLRKRLKELRPNSKLFLTVTASKVAHSGQKLVRHDPPMTSLEKASGPTKRKDYQDWINTLRRDLGYTDVTGKIVQSYKHDGVACALYYKDGKLVAAGLRPRNGIDGEDVLANVLHVRGVKAQLPFPITCTIRGELECSIAIFRMIKANWQDPAYGLDREPANPRNYTTGSIRQFKDPEVTKSRRLQFVGYNIEALVFPANYSGRVPKTKREQAKWANIDLGVNFVRMEFHVESDLQKMEDNYPSLDYEVDGVVLAVDDLEDYEQMGRHGGRATGNAKGALAWKFKDESQIAPYEGCIWSPGRTGTLTPVAQFSKALPLAGTNVTQCSMHNIAFAVRNGLVPGVKVEVIKSGKIIPKIITVIHPDGRRVSTEATSKDKVTRAQVEAYPHPDKCPACSHPTLIEPGQDGMWTLVCRNPLCAAQAVNTFVFFLTTLGARGIGESQIEALFGGNKIKTPADLYRLKQEDLEAVGMSERQATLALATIHMVEAPSKVKDNDDLKAMVEKARGRKKQIAAWQVFASLGIATAGKQAGKVLIEHFGSFVAIMTASAAKLNEVGDIGEKTAKIIADYMDENRALVTDLLQYLDPQLPIAGKMSGKVFCLSGKVDKGRLEKAIEAEGGTCTGSVSKKVDFLVAGDGSGSKSDVAKALQTAGHHIQIIDAAVLEKMLS